MISLSLMTMLGQCLDVIFGNIIEFVTAHLHRTVQVCNVQLLHKTEGLCGK